MRLSHRIRNRLVRLIPRFLILVALLLVAGLLIDLVPDSSIPAQLKWVDRIGAETRSWIGLVELLLVLAALIATGFHFRQERAARFIERFNSPEVVENRLLLDRWLGHYTATGFPDRQRITELSAVDRTRLDHTEARLLLELRRDPGLDKAVKSFANLFQEMGQAYRNNTISRRYTWRMFDHLTARYWDLLQFWVETYQAEADETLYSRFKLLAEELRPKTEDREESGTEPLPLRNVLLREATRPRRVFIFAYGSLIHSVSREAAVGECEVRTATLSGYERGWHLIDNVLLTEDEPARPRPALFLDLALSKEGDVNGVLVPIDGETELKTMDGREKNYLRVDVSQWIRPDALLPPGSRVYTYIGLPEKTIRPYGHLDPGEGLCVLGGYLELLEKGLKERDAGFASRFHEHTLPRPGDIPIVDGPYRFLDPEQNQATGRDEGGDLAG